MLWAARFLYPGADALTESHIKQLCHANLQVMVTALPALMADMLAAQGVPADVSQPMVEKAASQGAAKLANADAVGARAFAELSQHGQVRTVRDSEVLCARKLWLTRVYALTAHSDYAVRVLRALAPCCEKSF